MRLVLILFIILVGCTDGKICESSYDGIGRCHTKEEWDKISKENWAAVECMNNPKNVKKSKNNLEALMKICNMKEFSRVEFK